MEFLLGKFSNKSGENWKFSVELASLKSCGRCGIFEKKN
jgi:hypothetical protein